MSSRCSASSIFKGLRASSLVNCGVTFHIENRNPNVNEEPAGVIYRTRSEQNDEDGFHDFSFNSFAAKHNSIHQLRREHEQMRRRCLLDFFNTLRLFGFHIPTYSGPWIQSPDIARYWVTWAAGTHLLNQISSIFDVFEPSRPISASHASVWGRSEMYHTRATRPKWGNMPGALI